MNNEEELLNFYKDELVCLKESIMSLQEQKQKLIEKVEQLEKQNNILKENNDNLSEMFTQYKEYTSTQIRDLEFQLVNLSVERADRELLLDTLHQEIRQLKKANFEKEQIIKEQESIKQGDNVSSFQDSPDNLSQISQDDQSQRNVEIKQEQVIYLKKQFHTPQKNNKPEIQSIIDSIPKSEYTILYEEEMKKIKDISNKQFEMKIWQDQVMVLFKEKYKNEKIINGKLRELLRNSYPEQHRGKIWSFLIGNQLQINKQLYEKLLLSIPNHPLITNELKNLINKTFTIINDFENSDKLKDELREILTIFHIYRPDMGYIQGMTYLAFMFLIRMPKQKALKCLANILFKSQLLRTFYQFKSHYLEAYFLLFDSFFQEKLPVLANKFNQIKLPKQSFLVEWFYTVFSRAFNLITSSKIWDYFLCEGDLFLIRLTLAVLSNLEPDLLKCEYEDILMLIRQKTYQIKIDELFKHLNKFKIEQKTFQIRLQKQLDDL
ncbi:unnamed protein product [Paramecium pentaurelia]|uniref:Rab-GAP TBC domain-containing protein n=1 Tax=Paramecium pentaurelia TaxID=43138 RepID=A0A8S1XHE5_9CILI|nr:unnamed protein product [Paramecium pentaurelia]